MIDLVRIPELDDGPKDTILDQLFHRHYDSYGVTSTNGQDLCSSILGFANDQSLKMKSRELEALISEFISLQNDDASSDELQSTAFSSIVSCVFHSNKIEFAGMSTERETGELVERYLSRREESQQQQHYLNSYETAEREVIQMFQLLQSTFKSSDLHTRDSRAFHMDCNVFKQWHKALFDGILDDAGEFRIDGRQTTTMSGDRHVFPHHTIVKKSLSNLCLLLNDCRREVMSKYQENQNRVLYSFALAAFAQFHFVDIHPFSDGNGRMCRLISKRFVDWVCPVPFPQFTVSRDIYLRTVNECRRERPDNTPRPLLVLLLDAAIQHYRRLLQDLTQQSVIAMCACSEEELTQLCKEHELPETDTQQILSTFASTESGDSFDFTTRNNATEIRYLIKRYDEITLDDL